ncbi:hypothetical protein [Blastomonas sp.]|uniref:hypothetical protein n=1 Tax=Blastomonas sp. TaxID=1909299 RepID=UPI0035948C86
MKLIAPLMCLPFVAGCLAPMQDFPSLERRDIETRDRQAEALAPPPPVVTVNDPALAGELRAIEAKAEAARQSFAAAVAATRQSVNAARGAAVGSESWSVAQTQISALGASRRELSQILGDLDARYVARLQQEAAGTVTAGGSTQILDARTRIIAVIEAQDQTLAAMKAGLAG